MSDMNVHNQFRNAFKSDPVRGWEKDKGKDKDKVEHGVKKGHDKREDTDDFIRDTSPKEPERPKYSPTAPKEPEGKPETKPEVKPEGSAPPAAENKPSVPAVKPESAPATSGSAGTGRYKLTVTYTSLSMGYASGSYSKNDALLESLREKYGADICVSGGDLSQLTGEELAALEQEMQLSGQSSVMWGSYTQITIEMSFNSMEELEAALGQSVDILCAARQAQGNILPQHYSGEELVEQTSRMDQLYRESVQKMADAFADLVGGFLDENGAIGQGETIGMSVQSLYAGYQSKYQSISDSNGDPTGTIGTKDAWLSNHFGYLTSSLLQLGKGMEVPTEEGLYSLQELQFAAMSVTAWHSSISKAEDGTGGSEVRQALTVSMISMKIEVASARGYIGKELSDVLRTVQDNANEKVLNAMDRYQARRRGEREDDEEWKHRFPNCDRDLFHRVHKKVMDSFRKTSDATGAIREGAAMARPELTRAMESGRSAERFDSELRHGGYWDKFFDRSPYRRSGYQEFEADWHRFMDRMGGDREIRTKA